MAIVINNYDGTPRSTVEDGTIDTATTSIPFVGRGIKGWGEYTQESVLWLLQNFAAVSSPANPVIGQLWFDTRPTQQLLKVYNGNSWASAGGIVNAASNDPPEAVNEGQLWYDTTNKQLRTWTGATWDIVGPLGSKINQNPTDPANPTNSAIEAIKISDTSTVTHQCWRITVAGVPVAIISKDPAFTPANVTFTGFGFSKIYPGVNLNSSISATIAGDSSIWKGSQHNLPTADKTYNIGSPTKRVSNVYTFGAVVTGNLTSYGTTYYGPSTNTTKPVVFGKTENLEAVTPRLGAIEFDGSNFYFTQMVQGTPVRQSPIFNQNLTLSRRLYVSLSGDDTAAGTTPGSAKKTLRGALLIAERGDTIFIESGDYLENNPLYVPPYVSIIGDNLRRTIIRPVHNQLDLFHANVGTYFYGMTFKDHRYPAFCFAFPCSTANVVITGGSVTAVQPMFSMTNYTVQPDVIVEPPPFGGITAVINAQPPVDGAIADVIITNNGSGYSSLPSVGMVTTTGSGAVFRARIDLESTSATYGQLVGIDVLDVGSGYASYDTISISGGNPTVAAIASPVIANGVIRSYNIVEPGSGYIHPPHLSIKPRPPLPVISSSPYVQNCSSITGPFDVNGRLIVKTPGITGNATTGWVTRTNPGAPYGLLNSTGAGGGLRIDGDVLSPSTVIRSFVADSFTQINQGGIGHLVINKGYAQFVSCFTTFSSVGYWARSGGFCNISNSVIDFGEFGLQAEGYYPVPYETGELAQTYNSRIGAVEISLGGGGQYYQPGTSFNVTFVGGGGSGGQGVAFVSYDGSVGRVEITNQGSNYVSEPTIDWAAGDILHIVGQTVVRPTATVVLASNPTIRVNSTSLTPVKPTNSSILKIGSDFYTVISSSAYNATTWDVDIYPGLVSGSVGASVTFHDVSNISSGGLALEYVGSGVTYNALPVYGGVPNVDKQVVDKDSGSIEGTDWGTICNPGRVYYVTIDNTGNFKIGKLFAVNFADGSVTLNTNAISLSGLSSIGPFRRNGVPVGTFANEISNNVTLTHLSNPTYDEHTLVTQYSARKYFEQISSSVLPAATSTFNLGSTAFRWNDAYLTSCNINGNTALDAGNFNDYVPALNGTGAISGNWNIDILGNSAGITGGITSAMILAGLGYTPVRQGGGPGQGDNVIRIGWGGAKLFLQVDNTNFGANWPINAAYLVSSNNYQINGLGIGTPAVSNDLRVVGDITAFYGTSDQRLKENVTNIKDALNKVSQINGVEFDWTAEQIERKGGEDGYFVRKHDVGVIAQEVEKILPEVVAEREDGFKAVKYDRIVPLLIEAIKELNEEIKQLKEQMSKQ